MKDAKFSFPRRDRGGNGDEIDLHTFPRTKGFSLSRDFNKMGMSSFRMAVVNLCQVEEELKVNKQGYY